MREEAQLRNALQMLALYKGQQPLTVFLKHHFRAHPNMGSRDRKLYTAAIYAYYRLGRALPELDAEQRIAIGAYLSGEQNNPLFEFLYSRYNLTDPASSLHNRLDHVVALFPSFQLADLFPFGNEVSFFFDLMHMQRVPLVQPRVWIRSKPGRVAKVLEEAQSMGLHYRVDPSNACAVSFEQGVKLTSLKSYADGDFEVQDRSSQEALSLLPELKDIRCWDICAGSGGKSLQLADRVSGLSLYCTDVRDSILSNLDARFKKAGVKNFKLGQADLSNPAALPQGQQFDLILADVPCSGSGTWARNPDRISFFDMKEIAAFANLQRAILDTVLPALKPGGFLLYVTCSVFKHENEGVVEDYARDTGLQLLNMQGFGVLDYSMDKLFAALLQKS